MLSLKTALEVVRQSRSSQKKYNGFSLNSSVLQTAVLFARDQMFKSQLIFNSFATNSKPANPTATKPVAPKPVTATDKEKDKAKKEKEKEKLKIQKEKELQLQQKEKEKLKLQKEKEKEKLQKDKEKEKIQKEKDKEKEKVVKEKEKQKAVTDKEKALKLKQKEKESQLKVKDKAKEKQTAKDKAKELKPKRALTAYTFFFRDHFKTVRDANSTKKAPEITKLLGTQWNNQSESGKKPYIEKAAQDKERHNKEMVQYIKTLPPKKPPTAFIIFCNELRATVQRANPTVKMTGLSKLLGEQWRQLDEDKKKRNILPNHQNCKKSITKRFKKLSNLSKLVIENLLNGTIVSTIHT